MNVKTIIRALLSICLLFPSWALAATFGELRLSVIEGDVQIKTTDTAEWSPAVINFPLKDGDQIWVPKDGRAEVQSRRGTIIRLDQGTALDVLTVDNDALQFYLSLGLAYVNAKGERETTLQIDTPYSSLRVYDRAKFSAKVSSDGDTDISVYLGAISSENKKGETVIKAGNRLAQSKNSAALSQLGMIDEWERWNGDQDRKIEEQAKSVRYLPEELAGYANDFDRNGEWVEMPTYGYIWRPTVQVTADWSPYRHGRWVWIGDDYVWIAHEPWGWAPYHYGRWSFISNHGWCWVPPARHEVYWGPGYVGWVRTSTSVSWVPLAPKEVYYGHGYYGPHSVNIKKVDINKVVIKNVYRNVHVENSVTTVHHDTFLRGTPHDVKVNGNPFLRERISVGRPQIQPERATKAAGIGEVPKSNEPPDMVKAIKVEELKEHHRLDRKKNVPVPISGPETTERGLKIQSEGDDRRSTRNETEQQSSQQGTQPPVAEEVAPPAPAGAASTPPAAIVPPPEGSHEHQQRPQPEKEDRRSNREEGERRTLQPVTQPPAAEEVAPPAPLEAASAPPEAIVPPPESRQERQQRPQPEMEDRRSNREEGERRTLQPVTQPPAAEEVAPPAPLEAASAPPEAIVPPPESRQERQQRPQPEMEDRRSNREEEERRALQPVTQPPAAKEVPPPAAVTTSEGAKEEGAPPKHARGKKDEKDDSDVTEEVLPPIP